MWAWVGNMQGQRMATRRYIGVYVDLFDVGNIATHAPEVLTGTFFI